MSECAWWVLGGLLLGYPAIAVFAVVTVMLIEVLGEVAFYGVARTVRRLHELMKG